MSSKLKLTKQIVASLSDEKLTQIKGGTDSDHFCTGGCTDFTCLANTCGCESVYICDSYVCESDACGCTSYIIC